MRVGRRWPSPALFRRASLAPVAFRVLLVRKLPGAPSSVSWQNSLSVRVRRHSEEVVGGRGSGWWRRVVVSLQGDS